MKVLHLGKFCPPKEGGIEIFSSDLLEYLNSRGIKADLLCFNNKNLHGEYKGYEYFGCKINLKLNSAPLSYKYFKNFKKIEHYYDIIHIHSPNPLAEFLSISSNKKVIIQWHSDIVKQKFTYHIYRPFQKKALQKASKIICSSPDYFQSSKQLYGLKNKTIIIPLGLNPERLHDVSEDKKAKMFIQKVRDKKFILSIGRLVEYKGFDYLIESANHLPKDVVILIAGDGPLYKKLKEKITRLNLQNQVHLIGKIENISILIKNCDLFCLPSISRNEAFGLVLIEALYFGKPLLTTYVEGSGMNYINRNGVTGLVVPPRDSKALSEGIKNILSNTEVYENFSKNAKERFKEFEINLIGQKIINLYNSILN
jgi:glycosyltransferase involved in cell wall biosynthesis